MWFTSTSISTQFSLIPRSGRRIGVDYVMAMGSVDDGVGDVSTLSVRPFWQPTLFTYLSTVSS